MVNTWYPVNWGLPVTGIFWDYENVPLRHDDWEGFLNGLAAFINANNIDFARVYARETTMSDTDYDLISELGVFSFKWVQSDDPNAADDSLIRSCIDVLESRGHINHILLISGDGDFLELTDILLDWQVSVTLVCQQHNYNKALVGDVHRAYSVKFVASNPYNWWIRY
ncbi:MAG: NYN domain-containing protein [Candidatus Odinarchaeota archaeon]